MPRHRVFALRGAAAFAAAAVVLFASSCSGSDAGCDGATRGCVLLVNTTESEVTISVTGGGSAVIPASTPSIYGFETPDPGTAWITVDSTVGASVTFTASQFASWFATCYVGASTWADPSRPPQVQAFRALYGYGIVCHGW